MSPERLDEPLLVGGMDEEIEHLLLDAGGRFPAPLPRRPPTEAEQQEAAEVRLVLASRTMDDRQAPSGSGDPPIAVDEIDIRLVAYGWTWLARLRSGGWRLLAVDPSERQLGPKRLVAYTLPSWTFEVAGAFTYALINNTDEFIAKT